MAPRTPHLGPIRLVPREAGLANIPAKGRSSLSHSFPSVAAGHSGGGPRRVVVVGGGITGLAAAHRCRELDPTVEIVLLEASDRWGGVLETVCSDGFLLERSADNFISNVPYAVNLCRRLGLESELLSTDDRYRRAFVVRRGRLYPVPDGFMLMAAQKAWPVLTSRLLSPWGKARLLGEYFVPSRPVDDESLASFARRRLGREAFERLVQPLVGGIYTADAEKLSLAATLPRFLEMERVHGGLIRAALRQRKQERGAAATPGAAKGESGARYSLFLAPRLGMAQMVEALVQKLAGAHLVGNATVRQITPSPQGDWEVRFRAEATGGAALPGAQAAEGGQTLVRAHGVLIATPAYHAAGLVGGFDAGLADELNRIEYAGSAIVSLGYRRDQVRHRLDGFGFVVPAVENRSILAGSFSSVKFAGRAPDDCVLIRVFLGGASHPELVELPESELQAIAERELKSLLGTSGAPRLAMATRWRRRMPQYHLGHVERVARIEAAAARHAGLELAGSAYRGVGIPDCIRSGESAAERLLGMTAAK